MLKNNCNCGSEKFYLQYKGNMVGKYCSGCNKWQRWVGKKDLEFYKRNSYIVFPESKREATQTVQSGVKNVEDFKCKTCSDEGFYLKKKGSFVGIYCNGCNKWQKWIGKKEVGYYITKGYKVEEETYQKENESIKPTKCLTALEEFNCIHCGGTHFYLKEKGNNIGKYCSSCNRWGIWLKRVDIPVLELNGYKIHPGYYISHTKQSTKDSDSIVEDKIVYVDDVVTYKDKHNVIHCNTYINNNDTVILATDSSIIADEKGVNISDTDSNVKDINIIKNDTDIIKTELDGIKEDTDSKEKENKILKDEANMFLLEEFVSNTPSDCSGCILEGKCEIMSLNLCESIKEAIMYVNTDGVF